MNSNLVLSSCVLLVLTCLTNAVQRQIIPVTPKGQKNVISVAQPLPNDLSYLLCKMPSLPPGENICRQRGVSDPKRPIDSIWGEICNSIAYILGYAKGTCMSVESPVASKKYISVCAISTNITDVVTTENSIFLTTEKIDANPPNNQKCGVNHFKVLYEKM